MKSISAMAVIVIFALSAVGCGNSTPDKDAKVTQDQGPKTDTYKKTDTGVTDKGAVTDKGPATDQGNQTLAPVGAPCEDGTECATSFCLTTETLTSLLEKTEPLEVPDGYCTKLMCSANADCGKTGKCLDLQGFDITAVACFVSCDPTDEKACRTGYTCFEDPRIKDVENNTGFSVCIPTSLVGLLPPLNAEGSEGTSSESE